MDGKLTSNLPLPLPAPENKPQRIESKPVLQQAQSPAPLPSPGPTPPSLSAPLPSESEGVLKRPAEGTDASEAPRAQKRVKTAADAPECEIIIIDD
jgi:hypothetical protein